MKNWILAMLFISLGAVFAQNADPASWKYEVKQISNCQAELIFTATVTSPWHLYSQQFSMNPLAFEFDESKSFKKVGTTSEPTPEKKYDDLLQVDAYYFKENVVVFKQVIEIGDKSSFTVTGKIYGQVCNPDKGICMPVNTSFSFAVEGCK